MRIVRLGRDERVVQAPPAPRSASGAIAHDARARDAVRLAYRFHRVRVRGSSRREGRVLGPDDAKIGRDVDGRILLFPDPMGATGSSLVSALSHYKTRLEGTPGKCITMHLIVTPEYIKNVLSAHRMRSSTRSVWTGASPLRKCWPRRREHDGQKKKGSTNGSNRAGRRRSRRDLEQRGCRGSPSSSSRATRSTARNREPRARGGAFYFFSHVERRLESSFSSF